MSTPGTDLVRYAGPPQETRVVVEQWGVHFEDTDIDWCSSEQEARDNFDLAREHAASDDPLIAHAYGGASLVRRTITTTVSSWRKVIDRH